MRRAWRVACCVSDAAGTAAPKSAPGMPNGSTPGMPGKAPCSCDSGTGGAISPVGPRSKPVLRSRRGAARRSRSRSRDRLRERRERRSRDRLRERLRRFLSRSRSRSRSRLRLRRLSLASAMAADHEGRSAVEGCSLLTSRHVSRACATRLPLSVGPATRPVQRVRLSAPQAQLSDRFRTPLRRLTRVRCIVLARASKPARPASIARRKPQATCAACVLHSLQLFLQASAM